MTVIDAESKLKVERTHLAQQVKERDDKLAQALIECERSATPPPPRSRKSARQNCLSCV